TGVCIGQHTNLCLGKPCADPKLIPSLLDGNGNLKSSRTYREAWAKGEEFTVLEEMVLEIEAQYARFKELVGHEPGYFEGHAVMSRNLFQGLEIVAQRHGLKYNAMVLEGPGTFNGKPIAACPMDSMKPDYDPWQCLKNAVATARTDMPNVFVCHPGYLDDFILNNSSLTINRTKEVAMLCDPAVKAWLEDQGVELITYDDV
ncbi:MAG: ChbG/HpnK family deacetylase, partial [Oscillospiraceae bacterium]|nr:ChbG/HpnK family deacetylase [Oscillospiraceae bacterium]